MEQLCSHQIERKLSGQRISGKYPPNLQKNVDRFTHQFFESKPQFFVAEELFISILCDSQAQDGITP